jgi:serine/threonine-protein kinase
MHDWRVAGFTELRELGSGAQGRVVLARHDGSGRVFAIKYLYAPGPGFQREARLLAQVPGPHVARLFHVFEEPGRGAAMVMEAVPGVPLMELLEQRGALAPEAALAVLKGSLLGLAAAHAVRIVHRDYKPANVIVPGNGPSKLIDFGIATPAGTASRSGTPAYMAPEQWHGTPASPATDVYAATCVFFECVAGERPYPGSDGPALMAQHTSAPIPVERAPGPVRPLISRGMAKDPALRPPGAAAFVAELEQVAVAGYGPDWERRGLRLLAEAAAALLAASPLVALLLQSGASTGTAVTATGAGATGAGATGGAGAGAAGGAGDSAGGAGGAAGGAGGAAGGAGGAGSGAAATGVGSLVGAKAVMGVAVLALAAGAGAVAVHHVTSGGSRAAAKPRHAPTAQAVTVAAVTPCKNLSLNGNSSPATVPASVRLPSVVKLPGDARVAGYADAVSSIPIYLIGPGAANCGYSIGADGNSSMTLSPDSTYQVSAQYSVGGESIVESSACQSFADVASEIRGLLQTPQNCTVDSTAAAQRHLLETGQPRFHVALSKQTPQQPPTGSYVDVSLQFLNTTKNLLDLESVSCLLPAAQSDICSAALTYFLIQGANGISIPQPALARQISAFVQASRT